MPISQIGIPTYHTRVEAWECDHNQHWNVRNYLRVFQQATFVVADLQSTVPDLSAAITQHTRYHRELFNTSEVEVRSAVLADGPFEGALVHILSSGGKLSATALMQIDWRAENLPRVFASDVLAAMPRGIDRTQQTQRSGKPSGDMPIVEHGFIQPVEVDHTGSLTTDRLMGRIATASNRMLFAAGFTPEFTKTHGISRMGIETRITRFSPMPIGMRLCSTLRATKIERKLAVLSHSFFTPDGTEVASADQALLAVDMKTRRATDLPDFMHSLAVLP